MNSINGLVGWIQAKVDQLFGFFGFYSQNYSKYLVYALLLVAGAKIFKVKLDVKTGGR